MRLGEILLYKTKIGGILVAHTTLIESSKDIQKCKRFGEILLYKTAIGGIFVADTTLDESSKAGERR